MMVPAGYTQEDGAPWQLVLVSTNYLWQNTIPLLVSSWYNNDITQYYSKRAERGDTEVNEVIPVKMKGHGN